MKPVSAQMMSEIDIKAQSEYGIPAAVLMENAGTVFSSHIMNDLFVLRSVGVAIFCGKGNNGGDGFVVARHLYSNGIGDVRVYLMDNEKIKKSPALENFEVIKGTGIYVGSIVDVLTSPGKLDGIGLCVDAVFGTGFKGRLPENISRLWDLINGLDVKRYALDIPSGLDATSGEAAGNCFNADKTITFGLPKSGQLIKDGPRYCGETIVENIGFPEDLLSEYSEE